MSLTTRMSAGMWCKAQQLTSACLNIMVRLWFQKHVCADVLQPLPQKHSFKRLDRFNQEFVRTRMVALQNFLQRIADHPVLSFSRHFYTFLTAKQWVRHVAEFAYAQALNQPF